MTDKLENTPTDAATKARSLGRWENEGGTAPTPGPAIRKPPKPPKRPRDPNQLAKLITDLATGGAEEASLTDAQKRASKGGKVGGTARAKSLTPRQRSEIAQAAAQARWKKKD